MVNEEYWKNFLLTLTFKMKISIPYTEIFSRNKNKDPVVHELDKRDLKHIGGKFNVHPYRKKIIKLWSLLS